MNEIIRINERLFGDEDVNSVDARELWLGLESGRDFSNWIKTKVVKNKFFDENQDFILLARNVEQDGHGGSNRKDYALTLDCAKKVAMSEQTAKGDKVREYFLKCERELTAVYKLPDFTNPAEAAIAWAAEYKAKEIANEKVKSLEYKIEEDIPKIKTHDALASTSASISIGEFSKVQTVYPGFGQNKLYKLLRNHNVLMSFDKKKNYPYQNFIDCGYFDVDEYVGDVFIGLKTLLTGRGQIWLAKKMREWKNNS